MRVLGGEMVVQLLRLTSEEHILARFEVKLLALHKVEPGQNCRNDLVHIPIKGEAGVR